MKTEIEVLDQLKDIMSVKEMIIREGNQNNYTIIQELQKREDTLQWVLDYKKIANEPKTT